MAKIRNCEFGKNIKGGLRYITKGALAVGDRIPTTLFITSAYGAFQLANKYPQVFDSYMREIAGRAVWSALNVGMTLATAADEGGKKLAEHYFPKRKPTAGEKISNLVSNNANKGKSKVWIKKQLIRTVPGVATALLTVPVLGCALTEALSCYVLIRGASKVRELLGKFTSDKAKKE